MRGIDISSLLCPICSDDCESIDHTLLRCKVVRRVWRTVAKWCGVAGLFLWEVRDLHSEEVLSLAPPTTKSVWEVILTVSAWCIWRARNKKIKKRKVWCLLQIISGIQILSFLWFSPRRKNSVRSWTNWVLNPLGC